MEELATSASVAPPAGDREFWAELQRLVDARVVADYRWYRDHAAGPHVLFRSAGALVVLLGVSIPLIAALEFAAKDVVLSIVSLAIAALTGLSAFFRLESTWQSRRQTEYALAHLLSIYDLRLLEARHEGDPARARQTALAATRELLDQARAATGAETEEFFSRVVWPQQDRR